MKTQHTIYAERCKALYIGREGENEARQVLFDLSHWRAVYGPGTVQLLVQRTGERTPYPVALTVEGSRAVWTVSAADKAGTTTTIKADGTAIAEIKERRGDGYHRRDCRADRQGCCRGRRRQAYRMGTCRYADLVGLYVEEVNK